MPGWETNDAPLYRLPFAAVFINTLTAAVLGASAGFLDAFIETGRERSSGMGIKLIDDPYCLQTVAEASYAIDTATLSCLNDCDEMMKSAEAGEPFTLHRRAELRFRSTRSAQVAAHAAVAVQSDCAGCGATSAARRSQGGSPST